jgi:hypothetical protein
MATELLWKRAVRRGIESQRRQPRECNFEQACDLSAFGIRQMHQFLAGGEEIPPAELNRRVSPRIVAPWRIGSRGAKAGGHVATSDRDGA